MNEIEVLQRLRDRWLQESFWKSTRDEVAGFIEAEIKHYRGVSE